MNYKEIMQYIETQESTDISYVKVGEGSKKLIVSFSSDGSPDENWFQWKKTLITLFTESNSFDVLFLRNQLEWYLGGLKGIGEDINCTIAFLKKEFAKYNDILCIGSSAGGYASLLFGSLLNVNKVIAINPQTDLEYVRNGINRKYLNKLPKESPATWRKYNKIANVLSDDLVCDVLSDGDEFYENENKIQNMPDPKILHGDYHYDQIKHFPNVNKIYKNLAGKGTIHSCLLKFLEE